MKTQLELFPKVETTLSDLEDHNTAEDLKLRIFNTLSGNSIIGIVLKETPDSFLVALPSKLMAVKDKRAIEPYMPIRFCRMHKATILTQYRVLESLKYFIFNIYSVKEGDNTPMSLVEHMNLGSNKGMTS
jgi:hypothetical protein